MHSGTTDAKKMICWMELMRAIYEYASGKWNGKGPIIKELFDMKISDEKVAKAWQVLGLEPKLVAYFNKRVQKFLMPRLAQQQDAAKQIMSMNDTWTRVQKRMNELRIQYDDIERKRRMALSAFTS